MRNETKNILWDLTESIFGWMLIPFKKCYKDIKSTNRVGVAVWALMSIPVVMVGSSVPISAGIGILVAYTLSLPLVSNVSIKIMSDYKRYKADEKRD